MRKALIIGVFTGASLFAASLPEAVQNDDQAAVQALLKQKVDVNAAQGDGTTALHWAAFNDNLDLAKTAACRRRQCKSDHSRWRDYAPVDGLPERKRADD